MAEVVLWIDLAAFAVLLPAAISSVQVSPGSETLRLLAVLLAIFAVGVVYAAAALGAGVLRFDLGVDGGVFWPVTMLCVVAVTGGAVVVVFGARADRARAWNTPALWAAVVGTLILAAMTGWVLDLTSRIEAHRAREEAADRIAPVAPGHVPKSLDAATAYRLFYLEGDVKAFRRVSRRARKLAGQPWTQVRQKLGSTQPTGWMARVLAPELKRLHRVTTRYAARLRVTRLAVAVERHRVKTGTLPASLEAVAGKAPRKDPFSDEQLRYRRASDAVLLYSVGPDGDDDGGKRAEERGAPDGDLVFRLPLRRETR